VPLPGATALSGIAGQAWGGGLAIGLLRRAAAGHDASDETGDLYRRKRHDIGYRLYIRLMQCPNPGLLSARIPASLAHMRTVPLSEAKDKLSALVEEADSTHEIIQITRHGRVSAVIMSAEDLESLDETLHALRTPGVAEELAQADADYAAGNTVGGDELRRRYGLQ
jgi:antitoxin YefM